MSSLRDRLQAQGTRMADVASAVAVPQSHNGTTKLEAEIRADVQNKRIVGF